MFPRRATRLHGLIFFAPLLLLGPAAASAQVDPVQLYPIPEATWNAILGAANMDQDPADEIVLISEDDRLLIVDAASGAIEFDSDSYNWANIYAPGWDREIPSTYHRSHGYGIFCDEDGDGIHCVNVIVNAPTQYDFALVVICLDRSVATAPQSPSSGAIQLRPNVPNPTLTTTRIDFTLAGGGPAVVRVFDVQGRLVRTLLDKAMPAGDHSVVWDGRSDAGHVLSAGTYFYELNADGQRAARKAVLIK